MPKTNALQLELDPKHEFNFITFISLYGKSEASL